MNKVLIEGTSIKKSFLIDKSENRYLEVLHGVDISINRGEMIAIIGASGSGKSTLLNILGGLDKPSEGKVFWKKSDISGLSDEEIAKQRRFMIGFVFQFHNLLPEFTALENVIIPMMIAGEKSEKARNRAEALLSKVGLIDRMDHRPSELSGGELQRVAVSRALANQPEVILADEPTGNLDSENSEKLIELLMNLHDNDGQTIVVVTHSESLFQKAGRILKMVDGKLYAI